MISRTCRAHCCSPWALARNLSRSSIPLMCSAHSTRSCTLASPSTPWGRWQARCWGPQGATTAPDLPGTQGRILSRYLLLRGVRGDVQHIAHQQQDPLNQQRVLLLPLLPVLGQWSREGSPQHPQGPRPPSAGMEPQSLGAAQRHRTHQLQQVVELLAKHPKNFLTGESLQKPLRERGGYGQRPPPRGPSPGRLTSL